MGPSRCSNLVVRLQMTLALLSSFPQAIFVWLECSYWIFYSELLVTCSERNLKKKNLTEYLHTLLFNKYSMIDGEVEDSTLLAVPGVGDLLLALQMLDVGVEAGACAAGI